MANNFGWNETQEKLVRLYKELIYPTMNNKYIFPEFIDSENDRNKTKGKTFFKFGVSGWIGVPNPFCRTQSDIPSFPHFSFRFDDEKSETYDVWIEISGIRTIERFLNMNSIEKNKFIELLKQLSDDYYIVVQNKIKEHHFAQRPKYENVMQFKANKFTESELNEISTHLEQVLSIRDTAPTKKGTGVFPVMGIANEYQIERDDVCTVFSDLLELFSFLSKLRTKDEISRQSKIEPEEDIVTKAIKCPSCGRVTHGIVINENTAKCNFCDKDFSIDKNDIYKKEEID